jgi:hypothetical protein
METFVACRQEDAGNDLAPWLLPGPPAEGAGRLFFQMARG